MRRDLRLHFGDTSSNRVRSTTHHSFASIFSGVSHVAAATAAWRH